MSKRTRFLLAVLIITFFAIIKFVTNGNKTLVRPNLIPGVGKTAEQLAIPVPSPAYNPPKEIKYDSATELKKELESVNPQVLDSDFE